MKRSIFAPESAPRFFIPLLVAGIITAWSSACHGQLLTDLEVHYSLDANATGPGGQIIDGSGNGYNATLTGGGTSASGMIQESILFSSGRTTTNDLSIGNFDGGSFSVSLWFNTSNIYLNQALATKGRVDSTKAGWALFSYGNSTDSVTRLIFAATNSAGKDAIQFNFDTALASNTWYQAAFSYDAENATITAYLNGTSLGSYTLTTPGAVFNTTAPLTLGASAAVGGTTFVRSFAGRIDDFGLWSRALTAEEVESIYLHGLAGQAIPEPSAAALGGLAGIVFFQVWRRKKR